MKKRGKVLLVLSATMVTLVGSVLPVSAAPTYADLFDAEYYAGVYSDVAAAYGDDEEALFNHYINYGIYEGRVGSEAFNVLNYRESYSDLEAAYGDDWKSYVDHYLTFGLTEGRNSGGLFDAVSYANRYPDLKEAFGYDVGKLWAHYEQFGMKEGRNPVSQTLVNEWAAAAAKAESAKTNAETPTETPTETPAETPAETQAPLVLSGNAEDSYTTTRAEYIETDNFILYLDENITIKGNLISIIDELLLMAEEQTGLTYAGNPNYAFSQNVFIPEEFYEPGIFPEMDPNNEKPHIFVVADEKYSSCATSGSVILNEFDVNYGGFHILIHEYIHCLQLTNGIGIGDAMDEGFATYHSGQIVKENPDFFSDFNPDLNYSFYDREITPENAEAILIEEKEDGWENYLYGYRFLTFLSEEYSEQVYIDILNDATEDAQSWEGWFESDRVVPYIKANTSEDVFVEFANWLEENKERIDAWGSEY